jgi:hypothetical protein
MDTGFLQGILTTAQTTIGGIPWVWTGFTGHASASGPLLSKVGGGAAWDSGAEATVLLRSGDGYAEFVITSAGTTGLVFGLSTVVADNAINNISWGVLLTNGTGSYAYSYADDDTGPDMGPPSVGDVYRVGILGGVVKMWHRAAGDPAPGTLFYTGVASPTYPLYAVAQINIPGASVIGHALSGAWS